MADSQQPFIRSIPQNRLSRLLGQPLGVEGFLSKPNAGANCWAPPRYPVKSRDVRGKAGAWRAVAVSRLFTFANT